MNAPRWGVYQHAFWNNVEERVELNPAGGFVVREVSPAVPYGRMEPIKVYKVRAAAERLADKLTFGET